MTVFLCERGEKLRKTSHIWGALFIAPFIILVALMIMQSPRINKSDISGCYHDANSNALELRDGRIYSAHFKATVNLEYHKLKPYLHVIPRVGMFAPYMTADNDTEQGALYDLKTAGDGHVVGLDLTDRTGEARFFRKGSC